MILKLFTANVDLRELYRDLAQKHNEKLNSTFPDSGVDLYAPSPIFCYQDHVNKFDFEIQCSAYFSDTNKYTGYYLYPRSSLSKSPLRLANSVGIIDSGYRGNIMAMVDCKAHIFEVKQGERYFQICAPDLRPIQLQVVDSIEELSAPTERGSGGFGSTGH